MIMPLLMTMPIDDECACWDGDAYEPIYCSAPARLFKMAKRSNLQQASVHAVANRITSSCTGVILEQSLAGTLCWQNCLSACYRLPTERSQ
jgi:hypothetical protein